MIGWLQWYQDEQERAYCLAKARAVVDGAETISKAPEKAKAATAGERRRAREQAAPAYLLSRVKRAAALPRLLLEEEPGERASEEGEEERREVLAYVVHVLKEDLFTTLARHMRLR